MWCRLPNQDLPFLLNYHICLFDFKVLLYMGTLRKITFSLLVPSCLENWSLLAEKFEGGKCKL